MALRLACWGGRSFTRDGNKRAKPEEVAMVANINRREFLRYAMVGAAALGSGAVAGRYGLFGKPPARYGTRRRLAITEALVQMIDGTMVYHWDFEDLDELKPMPHFPGPLLQAIEGEEMEISIANHLPQVHGFRIPGVPGDAGAGIEIAPGETKLLDFIAPEGGSYIYYDHLNAPVNRVLGLHGPMIILPSTGNTPYSRPTPNIQRLFDDLGTEAHFPGQPWKPERTRIWIFHSIDPRFNAMAERGEPIDAAQFKDEFLPRYFTINGLSGAFAAHDHSTVPSGRIGQPHLLRIMDTGMTADSPHIHGNHVYLLARRDETGHLEVRENVFFIDTFTDEVSQCMDWLLPFIRPPDIPGDPSKPLRELLKMEFSLTLGGVSQSPLAFPMHGHNEQSQSAAGGNYPQGLVTGWEITGDLDGVPFPHADPDEKGGPPELH
ncbi:MAG: multicopper oxidase domain-containing protein [Chloroflexi bacterium]|nr:multicopper oxidase domain-containing protein [Chloroflexota bacterium]